MTKSRCLVCKSVAVKPWASASDVEYATSTKRFTYLNCADCGALSITPVPSDRLSEIYPSNYYSFAGTSRSVIERTKEWLDKRMFQRLLAEIEGNSLRGLDVGGGNGWLLSQARAVDPRLTETVVVDLDATAANSAESFGHEFVRSRIEDYRTEKQFDLILMLNLIEHVEDPVGVLRRMHELLAPGGVILVKTPNHASLDGRLFRHRNWGGYHCPRHWAIFTPDSFKLAVRKAGLTIRAIRMTQGAPFWAVSVLAALSDSGLVRIDRSRPMWKHPLFGPLLTIFAAFDLLRSPFSATSQMFAELTKPEAD